MSRIKRFLEDLIEKLQMGQQLTTLEVEVYNDNKEYIDSFLN